MHSKDARRHRDGSVCPRWLLVGLLTAAALGGSAAASRADFSLDPSPDETISFVYADYRATLTSHWPGTASYRPIHVRIEPLRPLATDHTLTVQATIFGGSGAELKQSVEMPAGQAPVEFTWTLPEGVWGGWCEFALIEDERALRAAGPTSSRQYLQFRNYSANIAVLAVEPPTGDSDEFFKALESISQGAANYYPGSSDIRTAAKSCRLEMLPERWIDYSGLDCVLIGLDKLSELHKRRPAAHRALVEWAFSGGNLLVYDTDGDAKLQRLERLLGGAESGVTAGSNHWREPEAALYPADPRKAANPNIVPVNPYAVTIQPEPDAADAKHPYKPKPEGEPPFLLRCFGQGKVAAIRTASPLPGDREDWGWLLRSIGDGRLPWVNRHGLHPAQGSSDFWNFTIPGVGLTPVKTFCVLISVFACLIGPLNYWLLARKRRLHLLVLTIPGGAMAVILAMIGYAVISDGLGTRVRMRSATVIDQSLGQAACWMRTAYYAGLAPRGLRFGDDTALSRIMADGEEERFSRAVRRRMTWDDGMDLTSGWIPARTPTQFLTVRCRPTERGVRWIDASEGGRPRIENKLGTQIKSLFICGPDGQTYWAEAVDDGREAALVPIDAFKGRERLQDIVRKDKLDYPPGYGSGRSPSFLGMRSYRYNYGSKSVGTISSSLLEQSLTLPVQAQPRSYAAVVDRSPEADHGLPKVSEEAGFHLILGSW